MPSFVSWIHLFPAILEIIAWLENEAETTDSEYLISSRARSLMEHVTPNLEMAGIDFSPDRPVHGTAYLPTFVEAVESLLTVMGIGQ